MSARLCRCTQQVIATHEKRRGDHPNLPRYDDDILRSLAYWRSVRNAHPHCAQQYRMHREAAMRPARLTPPQLHPTFAGIFRMELAA